MVTENERGESTSRFSIEEALQAGWNGFKSNAGPLLLYAVIVIAVDWVLGASFGGEDEAGFFRSGIANLISFVVGQLLTMGYLRIGLDIVDGRAPTAERVREAFTRFAPFAIAAVIFSLLVTVGMLLLIIPGVIVVLVFGFYGWTIVDGKTTSAVEALKHSAEITRGERLHLLGFGLALLLLNILGLVVFIVGVIVTSAISVVAVAHVYRRLGPAPALETSRTEA